ncbi:hypothetical protein ACFL39_01730 [Gemmatimonadota bacterium]
MINNRNCRFLYYFSILLFISCSKADRGSEIPEGHLELVWAVQPEDADEEPWFGTIAEVAVRKSNIAIADYSRGIVIKLDQDGHFTGTMGGKGHGPGEFGRGPRRISFSPSGHLLVQYDTIWQASLFSPQGDFIKRIVHGSYVAGQDLTIENPFLLDSETIVWRSSRQRIEFPDTQSNMEAPPLLTIRNEVVFPLGIRTLNEKEDAARKSIIDVPEQDHIPAFTSGEIAHGQSVDEILFVKNGAPYTVHRFSLSNPPSSFVACEVQRDEWIKVIEIPYGERNEKMQQGYRKYLGEHTIIGVQRPPEIYRSFSFTHTQRGLARYDDKLAILVETFADDFNPNILSGGFEQYIYIVDLQLEKAVLRVKVDLPLPQELEGALEDGTLIFSTNDPVPGILAYEIVPN